MCKSMEWKEPDTACYIKVLKRHLNYHKQHTNYENDMFLRAYEVSIECMEYVHCGKPLSMISNAEMENALYVIDCICVFCERDAICLMFAQDSENVKYVRDSELSAQALTQARESILNILDERRLHA